MKRFTIDLDEDQILELFEKFVGAKEEEDVIDSLSLIFRKYEGSDIYEPTVFFYPDWDIDFEVGLSLTDLLQGYLDEEGNDDEDHRDLVSLLLATTNKWLKQQQEKVEAP